VEQNSKNQGIAPIVGTGAAVGGHGASPAGETWEQKRRNEEDFLERENGLGENEW
jgi:hypothetical protein